LLNGSAILSFLSESVKASQFGFRGDSGAGAILLIKRKKRIPPHFKKGFITMKRIVLAGLTVLTLAVTVASPASALSPRFRDAHRLHNDVTGKAFAPALTTEAQLTGRFKVARDANYDKLNPRFKESQEANRNKLNPRFKEARDRNVYN
jgi:hypothetical protein